ncbi:MAG: VOC family protein [Treponema sp.]|jgi:PhnB protein|nr:VOC family protein [Treponema sp.]
MKVSPYLQFNGNCAEAIAFYEKAFEAKAEITRYKDAPPSEGYKPPPGTEDFVMHASIALGDAVIMLCDLPPDMKSVSGDNVAVSLTMENADQVKSCFNAMKEGGEVGMDLQETFWSKCFGSLEDKFGINWMLSI